MKVYRTDEIRNVVLLGHGGCGKTSLVEAMAYVSGATNRMGKITDGNTISDFDKEEQKREFSISTALVPIEWEKAKINVLDTPGYFDFVGEVEEAVSAADAAVMDFVLANTLAGTGDYSDLMVIPDLELSVEEYGIGFRQGSDLTAAVNQAMQELIDDGTLNELAVKYELADLLLANQ